MRFFVLALRNLTRNRRRTLISMAVVGAGTIGLLLTAGFVRFSFDGLSEAIIHGGIGHFEVVPRASLAGHATTLDRAAGGFERWPEAQRAIEVVPHVLGAAATLHVMGMASSPAGSTAAFMGIGYEPARERRMGFELRLRQGELLPDQPPPEGDDAALVAVGLAESLGVAPGDTLTLLAMTPDGMLNALDVRVAGIFTTGIQDLDTRFLRMHLASAQRLLQTTGVSNLIVGLDDTSRVPEVEPRLGAMLEKLEKLEELGRGGEELALVGWQERAPFYEQVRNLYRGIFWFLGSVVFVLVVLSTSNTLVMTVMERVRELGTLRAIGTSRGQLAALVLAEALWLGLFGALAGDAAGVLLILAINALGLQMPPPPGAVAPIDLQLALVPEAFGGAIVLMLVVLTLASLGPILRATRLRIVEALGHV